MTSIKKGFGISLALLVGAFILPLALVGSAHAQTSVGQLTVIVVGGGSNYANPQITVNGTNVGYGATTGSGNSYTYSPSWNSTTQFTMYPGSYSVTMSSMNGLSISYGNDCFGTVSAGNARTCVVTVSGATTSGYGLLNVYVDINNLYGYINPSNFTIYVSGNNANPSSFQASTNYRTVTLSPGSYSISIGNYGSYTQNYSGDCSGYISGGDSKTCTITLNYQNYAGNYTYNYSTCPSGYWYNGYCNYNTYYPYYQNTNLTCSPATQSAYVGQTASITASGGLGTYSWSVMGSSYPNVGSSFSYVVSSGATPQGITVTSGSQTATCYVTVLPSTGYVSTTYTGGGIVKGAYIAPGLPATGEGGETGKLISTLFGLFLIVPVALVLAYRFGRRSLSSILSADLS